MKRANLRKAKKICLKGGKRGIFLSWHDFLHLKLYLIKYMAKVQHDVVWAWLPVVNESMYSVDEPYFNFKFRPKFPPHFVELGSQGYDQQNEKGETCMQSSRTRDFGLRTSLSWTNHSLYNLPQNQLTNNLQRLTKNVLQKWLLWFYLGVSILKITPVCPPGLTLSSASKSTQIKLCS